MKTIEIKKTLMGRGKAAVVLYIKYPVFAKFESKIFEAKVNKYYKNLAAAFQKFAERELLKSALAADPEMPYSALLDFKISDADDILRVQTIATVFTGEGRGETARRMRVWDKKSGTFLKVKN